MTDTAEINLTAEIERLRAEVETLRARAEAAEAAADHDVLTPALNNIVNQIVDNATDTLEADLRSSIEGALSGLNFNVLGVSVPAGNLLFGALSPLIGDLADNLNGQVSGNVAELEGFIGRTIRFQVETMYSQEQYDVVLL